MIELDPKYGIQANEIVLSKELSNSLPVPISDIIENLEKEEEPRIRLQELCLSLIPMTFQYFALVLASEYLLSESPPIIDVTDCLWWMVRRPGPGKWVGFIREAIRYLKEYPPRALNDEVIDTFYSILISDERPKAKITKEKNEEYRLDYFDALVNIRNRFAHSRHIEKEQADKLFRGYFSIWKALINHLANLFDTRILIKDVETNAYVSIDSKEFDPSNVTESDESIILWDEKRKISLRLFPLIITLYEADNSMRNALFLEEVKRKSLLYLYKNTFLKKKEEYNYLIEIIDARTIEMEEISSDDLTISILGERIDRITKRTLVEFEDALKYIPEMFIERKIVSDNLNVWINSDKPGYILLGKPGTGKTSAVADWCVKRRNSGDHVLLLEAAKLKSSDLPNVLEGILKLNSPIKDCFDSIHNQDKNNSSEQKQARFIVVIDAVNEFIGSGIDDRSKLWQEINQLVGLFDYYRPYFKCLVTSRSDLWKVDFPQKESVERTLKRRLYYGPEDVDFPMYKLEELSPSEAREIFEKARSSIPGMKPETAYEDLPGITKRAVENPFLLRLVLQTYSERDAPALSRRKILNEFAKNKALEDKMKKDILFQLLERMSDLKKTEISLDEFLYSSIEKSDKKKLEEIEKIVLDPRPSSPYKKLIQDGIIGEFHSGEGELEEETIAFSQEKITNVMYSEFQRREINKMVKNGLIGFIVLIVIMGVSIFLFNQFTGKEALEMDDALESSGLSNERVLNISFMTKNIFYVYWVKKFKATLVLVFIFCLLGFVITLYLSYTSFLTAKIIGGDLPRKFLKEKLNEIKHKKISIANIPVYLFFGYIAIKAVKAGLSDYEQAVEILLNNLIPLFFLAFTCELLLGVWVVMKYAKSPQTSYVMFGPKEVMHSLLKFLNVFPILIVIFVVATFSFNMLDLQHDKQLIKMREEISRSEGYSLLKKENREVYEYIEKKIFNPKEESISSKRRDWFINKLFNKIIFAIPLVFPTVLLIELLLGKIVETLLRKKLDRHTG